MLESADSSSTTSHEMLYSFPHGQKISPIRERRFSGAQNSNVIFEELTAKYGLPVPRVLLDLYDLAQLVTQKDREVRREPHHKGWGRDLSFPASVREYGVWSNSEVQNALQELLEFTTGDSWNIEFQAADHQEYTYNLVFDYPNTVNLYETALISEGSDSLCGILCHLSKRSGKQLQGVHAISQEERAKLLSDHLNHLQQNERRCFSLIKLPIRQEALTNSDETLRSRSFLLLTLAVIVACQSHSEEIFVFENGLESLNFPLRHLADAEGYSRIMHPIVVFRMEHLISLIISKPPRFHMPFLLNTKAEVMRKAASIQGGSSFTSEWAAKAISCHHYSARTKSIQCGICFGCILRRLALRSAGVADISSYKQCLFTSTSLGKDKDDYELWHLYAGVSRLRQKLFQADSLSEQWECLVDLSGLDDKKSKELLEAVSQLSGVSLDQAKEGICDLYRRFVEEWEATKGAVSLLAEARSGD